MNQEKREVNAGELLSIHDVLGKISHQQVLAEEEQSLQPSSFAVHPETKLKAQRICRLHGTTVSAFVRACLQQLVEDYE